MYDNAFQSSSSYLIPRIERHRVHLRAALYTQVMIHTIVWTIFLSYSFSSQEPRKRFWRCRKHCSLPFLRAHHWQWHRFELVQLYRWDVSLFHSLLCFHGKLILIAATARTLEWSLPSIQPLGRPSTPTKPGLWERPSLPLAVRRKEHPIVPVYSSLWLQSCSFQLKPYYELSQYQQPVFVCVFAT